LIIMPVDSVHNIPMYHELTYAGMPFVFVDRYLPTVDCDYVVTDNHWGAFQATKWLIERGHRRIAHFTVFNSRSSSVCQRQQGYLDALTEHGLPHDTDLICPPSVYEHRMLAYKHALAYVRGMDDPATAVFAMNDSVVWATLQGIADLGLKLPGDVELAGFFDGGSRIGVSAPFLKVSQPSYDIGRIAAEALLDAIDKGMEHEDCKLSLKPTLNYSGSTAVASTDASIAF
jgi:DNA-binding LacI/PurR family transcriptional regulator